MAHIGGLLKRARNLAGLNQIEVIQILRTKYKQKTNRPTLSDWENDKSVPRTYTLQCLCELYNISFDDTIQMLEDESANEDILPSDILQKINDTILTPEEWSLITRYRQLDSIAQAAVSAVINIEYKRNHNEDKIKEEKPIYIVSLPYFLTPVSAGEGIDLDGDDYEMVDLHEPVPSGTDFIVRIEGDSMEPMFHHEDKVFVKKQDSIDINEIGLFSVNGEAFIKKLGENRLISLNELYPDIELHSYEEVKCFGKVVGICEEKI